MPNAIAKAVLASLKERHPNIGLVLRADITEAIGRHTRGMVAMTPKLIAALEVAVPFLAGEDIGLDADVADEHAETLRVMLAETAGEVMA